VKKFCHFVAHSIRYMHEKISLVWFDRVIAKTKKNAIILPLSVVYIPTL